MSEPRAGFGPVVGLGVVTAAVAALAGSRPWFSAAIDYKLLPGVREPDTSIDFPLALALGLVVLAGWGAALVTRAGVRRALLVVTALAALGYLSCLVAAPLTLPDQLRERLPGGEDGVAVTATGWYVAAIVAGVLATVAAVVAVRSAATWPEMGRRYDAPGAAPDRQDVDPHDERAVWKALDEGRDPTDPEAGPGAP